MTALRYGEAAAAVVPTLLQVVGLRGDKTALADHSAAMVGLKRFEGSDPHELPGRSARHRGLLPQAWGWVRFVYAPRHAGTLRSGGP